MNVIREYCTNVSSTSEPLKTHSKIQGNAERLRQKKKRFVLTTKRLYLTFSYETKIILNSSIARRIYISLIPV